MILVLTKIMWSDFSSRKKLLFVLCLYKLFYFDFDPFDQNLEENQQESELFYVGFFG